ncbi:MAG TPA: amylo-alpha-1,6-glucosidase [Rugosimonospora sp.]|nr:amylo-alpha-1,6-glucosidase [Rugosimonospora sp.]
MSIFFGPGVCGHLDEGAGREWLVPDGCGGYAMGTVCGLRTRRYHALLVTSLTNPAQRRVALAALDPVVQLPSGATVRLGVHEWASGTVSPAGHEFLERFDLIDGVPRWRWRIGDIVLERELAMAAGRPMLGVVHRLRAGGPVRLALEALCTWRDAHGERYASGPALAMAPTTDGTVLEDAYRLAGPGWEPAGEWYLGAHLREEEARGLPAQEDLWYAGRFTADLTGAGDALELCAWAGDLNGPGRRPGEIVDSARQRARAVVATAKPADDTDAVLALAADAFVVRGSGATGTTPVDVVAGYPWFGAWSRDTMISYEGLFLATGRAEEGRRLLLGYAETLSEGMLANTADTGAPEYNTVDGTLWFVHAIGRHVAVTGDTDLAQALLPALSGIVKAHVDGTRYGIRVDSQDYLLYAGMPGYALTWMDARVDGVGVTPRIGKPVEVNALWINALGVIGELSGSGGGSMFQSATESFRSVFPAPTGWLYDVVDAAARDAALRPNQLFAYALPYAPLRGQRPSAAIDANLLTPLGLRSLSPTEPGYRGRHRGGSAARDHAYHQGTVWPWLIGPYVDALHASGRAATGDLFAGLAAHLSEYGLGSVSETADGDRPHGPTGCPFQAWSVAETLRARRSAGAAAGRVAG